MSVSHGLRTSDGIENDDRGSLGKKKGTIREKIVSHRLGVSTGYGDAHQ